MAIWQFIVGLVPRTWIEQDGNTPNMLYGDDSCHDMSTAWKNNQPAVNLAELISTILPPAKSWCDSLQIWGDLSGNDIQVAYKGDSVESLRARIDAREDTSDICAKIVELARTLDCYLFFPSTHAVTVANAAVLSATLQNSQAARYSAAPNEFMKRLSHTSEN